MSAPLSTAARAQTPTHALSPSQVTTFLDCAARWYFSRVVKLPDAANGGLALGRAVHTTAAAVMRGKGATGELASLAKTLDLFDTFITAEFAEAELAPDESADAIHGKGREIMLVWHQQVAPNLAPAAVELALTGAIAGVTVHAIADLITTDGIVVDLKTASKKPGAISADHAFQLATYAMLAGKQTARLVTITKTTHPAAVQHTLEIGAKERKHAEAIYPLVAEAMQSGLYPPRRSSHLCSRKHCHFWRECVEEFGGDVQ